MNYFTIQDCRDCGFCASGIRRRFNALGLDFKAFMRGEFPLEVAAAVDDDQMQRAVQKARERIARGVTSE